MVASRVVGFVAGIVIVSSAVAYAQQPPPPPDPADSHGMIFDLGAIEVVGTADGSPGVGGSVLTSETMWRFDRQSLDQAVNLIPGVSSTLDANGRRNESDVFVRGFGRWQVPLLMDGVRIYLPADNRIDFARFLTADIAAVQVQKGYASVIDGPSAMGGVINLVTRKPVKPLEVEASAWLGGREAREAWSAWAMAGTRQERFYASGSINVSDRDFTTLSGDYSPTARSLQPAGRRIGSDSRDWRVNAKLGLTPKGTDEYTFNYTRQEGEKGAPLNVFNNPPVPANSYWRWPYWDVQNLSFLSRTAIGSTYVRSTAYYNTFENGLNAYDDATYTTQSANGRFFSPYDDNAWGGSLEFGAPALAFGSLKTAVHFRRDTHTEQNFNRPSNPTLSSTEPLQEQQQYTWSAAAEHTVHATRTVDLVAGASYEKYEVTKAEEFNTTAGVFEYPKGGADAVNLQGAAIWHYAPTAQVHASISNRARFPMIFELYSTRFGTATPNPDLGPERATNLELGWKGTFGTRATLEGAVFYSDVRDLIQTVTLANATTQTQNVGDGEFYGAEVGGDIVLGRQVTLAGNYTYLSRDIRDALQPNLRPTGAPAHKAFVNVVWTPVPRLSIMPNLDVAGDRWSDVNPAPAFPYVRTGAYSLVNLSVEYRLPGGLELMVGARNLLDDDYQLAWGFPQPGRTFFIKTRIGR